jgi:hypothetical protein
MRFLPGPMIPRAVGAAVLAAAVDYADLRMNRFIHLMENGQVLEWAAILADLFDVLPDGTFAGAGLDGAADGAIFGLVQSFTTRHLVAAAAPAAPAVPAAPAAPAAAAPAAAPSAPVTTPRVPATGASSAFDLSTAGY